MRISFDFSRDVTRSHSLSEDKGGVTTQSTQLLVIKKRKSKDKLIMIILFFSRQGTYPFKLTVIPCE